MPAEIQTEFTKSWTNFILQWSWVQKKPK